MTEYTLSFRPSIELEQFVRMKHEVSATFSGKVKEKDALKHLKLLWYRLAEVELDVGEEIISEYNKEKGMKSLRAHIKKRISKLEVLTSIKGE